MKMEPRHRIIKRGERYIPQYRHLIYLWWFWDEFEVDDNTPAVLWFDTQEEAEEFIERELGGENDEVVKEYF